MPTSNIPEKDYLYKHVYTDGVNTIDLQRIVDKAPILNDMDKGAVYGRISRSRKNIDVLLKDEFLGNKNKGTDFYNRILLEYGDDSVAELGSMAFYVGGISNLVSDELKKHRLGSYLEVSTRYTDIPEDFFVTPAKVIDYGLEQEYLGLMSDIFESYNFIKNELIEIFKEEYPIHNYRFIEKSTGLLLPFQDLKKADADIAVKSYNNTIDKKAIDEARYILPTSTKTNIGAFLNDRMLGYVIDCLNASRLEESRKLGDNLYRFFSKDIEPFIRRSDPDTATLNPESQFNYLLNNNKQFGIYEGDTSFIEGVKSAMSEYLESMSDVVSISTEELEKKLYSTDKSLKPYAEFASFQEEGEAKSLICAGIVQEYNEIRYKDYTVASETDDVQIGGFYYSTTGAELMHFGDYLDFFNRATKHSESQKEYIINEYVKNRQNRRHQPGRAFELADYVVTISCSYATVRELIRHRMMTVIREPLLTAPDIPNNYIIPRNIQKYPHLFQVFNKIALKSSELYNKIVAKGDYITAQYCILFGRRTSTVIKINLRQLIYLLELRTTPPALDEFRTLCLNIYEKLKVIHPYLANLAEFIDKTEYYDLNRLYQENKKEIKKVT